MAECFVPVNGHVIRVTMLDECGSPPAGGTLDSVVVSSGFVSVGLTAETETIDAVRPRNANSEYCVNIPAQELLSEFSVEIALCEVDVDLVVLAANAISVDDSSGATAGFELLEGRKVDGFALEVWTGVGGPCPPGGVATYGYLLLPWLQADAIGDFTVEEGALTFTLNGKTRAGGGWGQGPYDVVDQTGTGTVAGPLLVDVDEDAHVHLEVTTIEPPTPVCGFQALPT
jgi:hypothetical protein